MSVQSAKDLSSNYKCISVDYPIFSLSKRKRYNPFKRTSVRLSFQKKSTNLSHPCTQAYKIQIYTLTSDANVHDAVFFNLINRCIYIQHRQLPIHNIRQEAKRQYACRQSFQFNHCVCVYVSGTNTTMCALEKSIRKMILIESVIYKSTAYYIFFFRTL